MRTTVPSIELFSEFIKNIFSTDKGGTGGTGGTLLLSNYYIRIFRVFAVTPTVPPTVPADLSHTSYLRLKN